MQLKILSFLMASAGLLAVGALACSSSAGPSLDPAKTNCTAVCDQVQMCINQNLDVNNCISQCDDKSSDDSYKNSVAACADCVHGKTCSDSTSCVNNCLSAVANF